MVATATSGGTWKIKTRDDADGTLKFATDAASSVSTAALELSGAVKKKSLSQSRLVIDSQRMIDGPDQGSRWRPAQATKAIFEEGEWAANETLDPK